MAASMLDSIKRHLARPVTYELPLLRASLVNGSGSKSGVAKTSASDPALDLRWQASLRDCLVSKTFTRIMLLFIVVLLLGDVLLRAPTGAVLDNLGWRTTAPGMVSDLEQAVLSQQIDWSQFAYCQYVTTDDYLCNSLMIFDSLKFVGARADRVMLYPREWSLVKGEMGEDDDPDEVEPRRRLLLKARDQYNVQLQPIEIQHRDGEDTWADSFTKLLAFNQTQYKRVLSLDSDATVLRPMDELFLLPSAPVAMPRAYWLEDNQLSSQVVLVEPSQFEFERIVHAINNKSHGDYDMEIVNKLYAHDSLILPHRRYDLVTGEFRRADTDHRAYLGNDQEIWDAELVLDEAKFLHFSDWPLQKPWEDHYYWAWEDTMPKCYELEQDELDCKDRDVWKWAYQDFLTRRQRVCGKEFMPGYEV